MSIKTIGFYTCKTNYIVCNLKNTFLHFSLYAEQETNLMTIKLNYRPLFCLTVDTRQTKNKHKIKMYQQENP